MHYFRHESETNVEKDRDDGMYYGKIIKEITVGSELPIWISEKICREVLINKALASDIG